MRGWATWIARRRPLRRSRRRFSSMRAPRRTTPTAAQYFDANMKGADVPGGAGGVEAFKGYIIGFKPALHPRELVVGIVDAKTPEATLKLDTALPSKPEIGCEIQFDGVP